MACRQGRHSMRVSFEYTEGTGEGEEGLQRHRTMIKIEKALPAGQAG